MENPTSGFIGIAVSASSRKAEVYVYMYIYNMIDTRLDTDVPMRKGRDEILYS